MRARIRNVFVYAFVALSALTTASFLHAQIPAGTWVKQPGPDRDDITMTVEPCCNGGRRLTYRIKIGNDTIVMLVESPFNGTEVPVLIGGKPSGETMAIKTIGSRHWECVLKMNGKPFGTSKGELSADGKTLTVENNITSAAANQQVGIQKEVWIKK
jgi:hypothetical protein